MAHVETTTVVGTHPYATVRWSAIFGGWVVATGVASLMYVAGLAFGFSIFDPYNASASAKSIGIGTAIWIVLTWVVSLFLGGMFASWFDGKADQTIGTLHGVAVWGLAIAASGLFVTLGLTQALQGAGGIARGAAQVAGQAAATRAPLTPEDDALTTLQAQVTLRVAQASARGATATVSVPAPGGQAQAAPGTTPAATTSPGPQASPADVRRASERLDALTMALVARALYRGDTEGAKALLAANTSLSQTEIDQTVQATAAQVEKAKSDVKAAADTAARYTSMAMWIVFFSSLLSLIAAAAGGFMGAGHIHRVYHLRRYETVTAPPL
jgi:hypothetical protein